MPLEEGPLSPLSAHHKEVSYSVLSLEEWSPSLQDFVNAVFCELVPK